jgi:PAS domain S-box-containing protein
VSGDPHDSRLDELAALVLRLAGGEYEARGVASEARDQIDALIVGMNLLAETLQRERGGREEAEALLHDEMHAYEFAPGMFCSVEGEDHALVKCNSAFARAIGLEKEQLVGRSLLELVPEGERDVLRQVLDDVARGRSPERTDFVLASAGGEQRSVSLSASRAAEGDEPMRLRLILRDVTHERSLEAQLRQAQKLEAVGRLASGVAHDFNNILTIILGANSLLRGHLKPDAPGQSELAVVREAADQASSLTRQLLTFGRADVSRPAVHDLNRLVHDATPMLERTLGETVRLAVELHDEPLHVRIDANQLTQVILNVALNARDAIAAGGELSLRTGKTEDGRALLAATDDGQGMAPEVLERAFEPFFTTKQVSKGSGLGLAVCYGIVQRAGGILELRSRPGAGTTVRIELPLTEARPTPVKSGSPPRNLRGNGERILVVDDTPGVLKLMRRALSRAGYEVLTAEGGASALSAAAEMPSIDLLVTDVVMPDMSGPQLANELWRLHPRLPVLFVSGYTGDRLDEVILDRPDVGFLQKPFDAGRLAELVSTLLVAGTELGDAP